MPLKKIKDFDPNYRETIGSNDIQGFKVCTELSEQKIGSVTDILVDESGCFRYLVIDLGLWIFNKQIVLPMERSRIDYDAERVYVIGLSRQQAESLPQYNDSLLLDSAYEEQLRGIYHTPKLELANPIAAQTPATTDNRNTYNYQQDPSLYELNDPTLKKYEEQLIADSNRLMIKEVGVGENTETAQVGVPIAEEPIIAPAAKSADAEVLDAPISNQATRSACLIFNPVAGQSNPEEDLATIQQILQPEINLDIRLTTPEVDADQLAREAVERGASLIIASGGDGTLSAAAEAVVGTTIPFGVISRGTANAFATALGIPTTIEAACQTILDGKTRVVDAAYCNGKPMVLLVGIGFEAETVERADRATKNRFGMLAYVLAGIQALRNLPSFEARVETEDKIVTLNASAITIANAAPPTSILAQGPAELLVDDGLLDVTLIAPANTVGAVASVYDLLQSAYSGTATERPDIGFLRARSIKVTTDPPQKVVLDGELIGNTPVEVECVPGGLTIFVPDSPEVNSVEKLEGLPNLRVELKEPKAD